MTLTASSTPSNSNVRIDKKATNACAFARPSLSFANARTAFLALLRALNFSDDDEVLLPAYIGWSNREGSGVFDPVRETGVRFGFYRLTRELAIDVDDLCQKLSSRPVRLLVLIHYFGYPDPNLGPIVEYAHNQGALVLEDEAHALYSDWIGGICGRFGDAAIMSIHKMLPCESGGLLVVNHPSRGIPLEQLASSSLRAPLECKPLHYDLAGISARRRHNAQTLIDLLQPFSAKAHLLHKVLPEGVIPQSLPVIIKTRSRDELYFSLNASGFGVVSLYHTLIEPIGEAEFPDSHWLSRRVLNLPVHQDVSADELEALVGKLAYLL